tara:strand:- start:1664 stop:2944 length:1281 start_codon:yes stop_codon:yes gene_type:complete
MSEIVVIGAGYVGLTSSVCLAHLGHNVTCVDIDSNKVDLLNRGEVPIYEARLPELLQEGQGKESLRFTTELEAAVSASEFIFLCLPTPQESDGNADISAVVSVMNQICPTLAPGSIIINKSTVPIGTSAQLIQAIGRTDISLVSNPEFLREGVAVTDFLQPDRILIGASDREAAEKVAGLYQAIDAPVIHVDLASAETIKYATNSFLATKVSFVNALAAVCEAVGADIESVTRGLGSDQRIGSRFLQPGPGWGGSCFPKDMEALIATASEAGYEFDLLRAVVKANEQQFDRLVAKIEDFVTGDLSNSTIGVLGLTFKAHTDDMRNSPALEIVQRLASKGCTIKAYDPMVKNEKGLPTTFALAPTIEEAVRASDIAVILTEWPDFNRANWAAMRDTMKAPRVLDGRNILDRSQMLEMGYDYQDLGRL